MHYLIIGAILIIIIILQFRIFSENRTNINILYNIFPFNVDEKFDVIIGKDGFVIGIFCDELSKILNNIISSINKYLLKNTGAPCDYHLMKDIVDRNCDTKEEEIQAQIPVPLYLGLVGTMTGILIGVGFLVFGGGLDDLLGKTTNSNSEGSIIILMGGVAMAMISSIIGIILTTIGSSEAKNAKKRLERDKNAFLSWMHAELLPRISKDPSGALIRMTQNLSNFNDTFAKNTQELKLTLSKVNDSYRNQAVLLQAIDQLKIADIATANIAVYDKLKNSTKEIGVFAQFLQNSNEYLAAIQNLNHKLDDYEKRTQVIENAGNFFSKNEKWLAESFDIANLEVKAALVRFNKTTGESLSTLQESFSVQVLNFDSIIQKQQEKLQEALKITMEIVSESFIKTQKTFEKAIIDQQQALQGKLLETSKLVEELKNLTHIKEGIKDFKEATNRQNGKIDELTREIRALAKAKSDGGTANDELTFPNWLKILIVSVSSLLALTCLIYIVPFIILWISNLVNWIF
ncbi:MAG: hypothetical protein WCP85_15180 [Mariniphaga sp.]